MEENNFTIVDFGTIKITKEETKWYNILNDAMKKVDVLYAKYGYSKEGAYRFEDEGDSFVFAKESELARMYSLTNFTKHCLFDVTYHEEGDYYTSKINGYSLRHPEIFDSLSYLK